MITCRSFMKTLAASLALGMISAVSMAADTNPPLARPSEVQYAWHEQERIMFVTFGVATWEGSEYDVDGKTDLSKMNPAGFDADDICKVAKSWGAQEILLVCKHVGGFCWWPTETTDYCVRNIPWKNGRGNLVKEVADACRRNGLAMGIYIYPDDTRFTKRIGAGGKTDDPARQEEWNRLYRKQWEEVLTICGPELVRELWFDGGSQIPLGDIIHRLAPNAAMFEGWYDVSKIIRWVGNERGLAPDPNWDTEYRAPDDKRWMPVECDTTLYNHFWFWNPANESKRKSVSELLYTYVQSAGHGSVLLLNSTPNTEGRIPDGDKMRYREFGEAIERNFGHPLGVVTNVSGTAAEIDLGGAKRINCADLWEDYRLGHRIRAYVVEGRVNGAWVKLSQGTAVGRRKLDVFAPVMADRVRVRVTQMAGEPVIRRFQVHQVDDDVAQANVVSTTQNCPVKASTTQLPNEGKFLVDGNFNSYWSAADKDLDPWVEVDLGHPRKFACASVTGRAGGVRKFRIEFRNTAAEPWRVACEGGVISDSWGSKPWSSDFDRVTGRFVRLHILEYAGPSLQLYEFELRDRPDAWEKAGTWQGGAETLADLSPAVIEAGQYEVRYVAADGKPVVVERATLLLEDHDADASLLSGVGTGTLKFSRTQAVGEGASTAIRATLRAPAGDSGMVQIRPD
jgi:alpha-L-fucosidase